MWQWSTVVLTTGGPPSSGWAEIEELQPPLAPDPAASGRRRRPPEFQAAAPSAQFGLEELPPELEGGEDAEVALAQGDEG